MVSGSRTNRRVRQRDAAYCGNFETAAIQTNGSPTGIQTRLRLATGVIPAANGWTGQAKYSPLYGTAAFRLSGLRPQGESIANTQKRYMSKWSTTWFDIIRHTAARGRLSAITRPHKKHSRNIKDNVEPILVSASRSLTSAKKRCSPIAELNNLVAHIADCNGSLTIG